MLIMDLPRNIKEEDCHKLRAGSFRGRDLFVPEVVDEADRALKGFNAQQASLPLTLWVKGQRPTEIVTLPRMGRPLSLLLRGVEKGEIVLTRSVKLRLRIGKQPLNLRRRNLPHIAIPPSGREVEEEDVDDSPYTEKPLGPLLLDPFPVGSCLKHYWKIWDSVGADPQVVKIIRYGYKSRSWTDP